MGYQKAQKKALTGVVIIAISLGSLFAMTAPDDKRLQPSGEDQALSALGMGDGSSAKQNNSYHSSGNRSDGGSLFDSDFMGTGVTGDPIEDPNIPIREEGEPEILDPVSEGNPINPQTGQPYTDSMMKQFDVLREKFPGNSVIPQRETPEMKEKKEQERKSMYQIQAQIVKKEASEEQINQYYDFQTKSIRDRLELINYVLDKKGDSMSEEIKKKYTEIRDMNKRQLDSYEKARTRAINSANG